MKSIKKGVTYIVCHGSSQHDDHKQIKQCEQKIQLKISKKATILCAEI